MIHKEDRIDLFAFAINFLGLMLSVTFKLGLLNFS